MTALRVSAKTVIIVFIVVSAMIAPSTGYVSLALLSDIGVSVSMENETLTISSYYIDLFINSSGLVGVVVRGEDGSEVVLVANSTSAPAISPLLPLDPEGGLLGNILNRGWRIASYFSDGYKAEAVLEASSGSLGIVQRITVYSWRPSIDVSLLVTNTGNASIRLDNASIGVLIPLKPESEVENLSLAYLFLEGGRTNINIIVNKASLEVSNLTAASIIGGDFIAGIGLDAPIDARILFEPNITIDNSTMSAMAVLLGDGDLEPSESISLEFTVVYGVLAPIYIVQDSVYPMVTALMDLNEGVRNLASFQSTIERLNSTIQSLRETIDSLRDDLEELRAENEELEGAVEYWKTEYEVLREALSPGAANRPDILVPAAFTIGILLGVVGGAIIYRIIRGY